MVFTADVNPLNKSRSKLLLEQESMDLLANVEALRESQVEERAISITDSILFLDEEQKT